MKKILASVIAIAVVILGVGGYVAYEKHKHGPDFDLFEDTTLGRALGGSLGQSAVTYQASTRFLYSTDGGTSWSETIQEVPVGETYYLAIEMQVSQSEETKDEQSVIASVSIPYTEVLDCYLDDHPGTTITGNVDSVNNTVTYDFSVIASTTPENFRVIFECRPLTAGRASVLVTYDDSISESWDRTGTIKYV